MKRLLWLRLVLCVLLVPQLALGAQLPLVVQWMATAPLQLTWAQSTASEASLEPLPNFPHAPAVQSTRTRQGEAQLAQAELDEVGLPDDSQLFAEQAGGWGLPQRDGKYITKHVFAGSERVSSKMDPAWFQYPPTMYYHSDHLGSAQYVTIDNQEMVQHAEYLPSGELWQNASDSRFELARRFLFTGKELDIHTGLYDFGARQYDARQGQWLSPDPILVDYMQGRVNAGVYWPAQLGLYTFVANNPIKLVDPNGAEIILFGNAQEQRRVLGLLQKLTSDRLALRGDRVIIQSLGPDQSPKSVGTLLLRRLRHSERNVTIMAVLGTKPINESGASAADKLASVAGNPTDANLYLDERSGVTPIGVGKNGKVEAVEDAPPEIALAHELIHAESLMTGTANYNQVTNSYVKKDGSQRTEVQAQEEFSTVGISKPKPATENAIRREQGLRERQAVEPQ